MTTKKQGFNPYLPSWEYIPDGEPYVFIGNVYVYGSHDPYRKNLFQCFCSMLFYELVNNIQDIAAPIHRTAMPGALHTIEGGFLTCFLLYGGNGIATFRQASEHRHL